MERRSSGFSFDGLVFVMMIIVLAMVLIMMSGGAEAMSCGDAVNALIPCGSYLVGEGAEDPSAQCCASARGLNKMATTLATRRQLCECLKETGPSFGVVPRRAKHLPPFCKLKLDIPVSPNVNCTAIM